MLTNQGHEKKSFVSFSLLPARILPCCGRSRLLGERMTFHCYLVDCAWNALFSVVRIVTRNCRLANVLDMVRRRSWVWSEEEAGSDSRLLHGLGGAKDACMENRAWNSWNDDVRITRDQLDRKEPAGMAGHLSQCCTSWSDSRHAVEAHFSAWTRRFGRCVRVGWQ